MKRLGHWLEDNWQRRKSSGSLCRDMETGIDPSSNFSLPTSTAANAAKQNRAAIDLLQSWIEEPADDRQTIALTQLKAASVVIATTNVRHIELFLDARHWNDISIQDLSSVDKPSP
jgi:hypothetical protein